MFRPTCSGNLQLISDSYLNGYKTKQAAYSWVSWTDWKTVTVRKGDILGIFYDNLNMTSRDIAIPTHQDITNTRPIKPNSYVFLKDTFALAKDNGNYYKMFYVLYVCCYLVGQIELKDGKGTIRIAPLYVTVEPLDVGAHIVETPEQGPVLLLPLRDARVRRNDEGGVRK